jgi:large subunit ribosomal protein L15
MKLNEITDNPGAHKERKRVGRGIGSGLGKTGGRGGKGQKGRSGVAINGFEGGQMPIHRRMPKRGFNNIFRKEYVAVGLDRLQQYIDSGKLDPKGTITADTLKAAGVVKSTRDGVRILNNGEINVPLTLEVAGASKSAVAAIEKAGGSIKILVVKTEAEAS